MKDEITIFVLCWQGKPIGATTTKSQSETLRDNIRNDPAVKSDKLEDYTIKEICFNPTVYDEESL